MVGVLAAQRMFTAYGPSYAAALQTQFRTYGPSHVAILLVFAAGAAALVLVGRRHRGTERAVRFGRVAAVVVAVVLVPFQVYVLLPWMWNVSYSLPLQLCDLAWITAVYGLWTRRRWAHALVYYWGLTLSSQAFLTPELAAPDFPSREYLMFWSIHCFVVWAAIYQTWGLGVRPDWRSYRTVVLVTAVWAVAMLGFNALTGANYGFLNHKPPAHSLLDVLGPWPWYLLSELTIGLAIWALITWPWVAAAKRRRVEPPARQPNAA